MIPAKTGNRITDMQSCNKKILLGGGLYAQTGCGILSSSDSLGLGS